MKPFAIFTLLTFQCPQPVAATDVLAYRDEHGHITVRLPPVNPTQRQPDPLVHRPGVAHATAPLVKTPSISQNQSEAPESPPPTPFRTQNEPASTTHVAPDPKIPSIEGDRVRDQFTETVWSLSRPDDHFSSPVTPHDSEGSATPIAILHDAWKLSLRTPNSIKAPDLLSAASISLVNLPHETQP